MDVVPHTRDPYDHPRDMPDTPDPSDLVDTPDTPDLVDTVGGAGSDAPSGAGTAPAPSPAPRPVPVRRGESQRDIERGILRWVFVFFFATHIIGGVIWLAIYLTGNGGR